MPKIFETEADASSKVLTLTPAQKERFRSEYDACGSLDQFLLTKRAIILKEGNYPTVLRMNLSEYLAIYAPEYAFQNTPNHDVPMTFWRNVYDQINEDSHL